MIGRLIDFFIHPKRFESEEELRKARLLVRASLLTSLFSNSYLWLSFYFSFEMGKYMMLMNVIGFLLLPLLLKTRLPITFLGNLYVLIGAIAVVNLTYYSGGIESGLYPWIISIPVLALLVVDRESAIFWGALSFSIMIFIGILSIQDYDFPVGYDQSLRAEWLTSVVPGLLLIILLIAMVFEYTQRKALERIASQNATLIEQKFTIAEQKEELKALVDEKDYIIRILAHDLRGPLGNIKGLIRMMDMETEAERKDECKQIILRTSMNAENLVNRVLEMDRSEQDQDNVEMKLIQLNDQLEQIIQKIQEIGNKKSIKITFQALANDVRIKADLTYLQLIFENLLSNAIKFSGADTEVEVSLETVGDNVLVAVSDQGPGISEDEEELLFKKFSKLSARPTAGESSTGLGLSLVKRYAELVDGKVWFDRNLSAKGATFVVQFPLVS